jgi:hypothetical protein
LEYEICAKFAARGNAIACQGFAFEPNKRTVMLIRGFCVLAICVGLASQAFTAEGLAHRASCTVVRFYVAKYSEAAAESWARSKGATEAEIETARHCLKTLPAHAPTASDPR